MQRVAILVTLGFTATAFAAPQPSPAAPIVQVPAGTRPGKAVAIDAPRPEYPAEARKHHWVGVGWYLMHIEDSTGRVTSVDVLQSTGHRILDSAAVAALRKWTFRPHTGLTALKTPITFSEPATPKA